MFSERSKWKVRVRLIIFLTLALTLSAVAREPQVRLVSLLSESVTLQLGRDFYSLDPQEITDFYSTRTGIRELTIRTKSEVLYSEKLGISKRDRYTLVLFGAPEAPRPDGFWTHLTEAFEGEGQSHTMGYAVQVAVLRDEAFGQSDMSYLRVFHGAVGTASVELMEDDESKASIVYAGTSDLIPVQPGHHSYTLETVQGRLPLATAEADFKKGFISTFFLCREQNNASLRVLRSRFPLK